VINIMVRNNRDNITHTNEVYSIVLNRMFIHLLLRDEGMTEGSSRIIVNTNIRLLLILTRILFHKLSTLVGVHMGITIFGGVGVMLYLRFTWNWFCGDELSLHARFVQNPADNVYIIPSRIFVQNPAGNCPRRSGSNM